jgi:hypothetical protein
MQEDGKFAGYASVFGIIDSQNDVVMKGAFQNSLKKRAGDVKLLWQHQVGEPIGVFSLIREDSHGLYVEGRLLLDLQRGREAYSLLKNGAIKGLSIGYSVVAADYNGDDNIRLITDLQLWEISLVTFPANEAAVVTSVKENPSLRTERSNLDLVDYNKEGLPYQSVGFPRNDKDLLLSSLDRAIDILSFKYNADRPCVPSGNPDGWQWKSDGSSSQDIDNHPDIDGALKRFHDNATLGTRGDCARSIREALNANGFDIKKLHDTTGYAKDYGPSLENAGFEKTAEWDKQGNLSPEGYPKGYTPEKGDVVVINTFPGQKPSPAGHMGIYDGTVWYPQYPNQGKRIWPSQEYRIKKPDYKIYRNPSVVVN